MKRARRRWSLLPVPGGLVAWHQGGGQATSSRGATPVAADGRDPGAVALTGAASERRARGR